MEKAEEIRIATLVEHELNRSIKAIIEDDSMNSKEQLKEIKQAIDYFCKQHHVDSDEGVEYVKSILRRIADSERRNQEMDRTMGFYEGNSGETR
ncbi:MAG: hypothetical protein J5507_00715 [Clostridia bacterium]|nr:hypothetical protein [Clostridia bacterium]